MKKYFCLLFLSLFLLISDVKALTKAPVDVTKMSISEISEALDRGYLTSETLVNIYLERIEEYDDMFNSINMLNKHVVEQARELDKERAEGHIRGRLHGIPLLVKCNIDVYGMPTTGGTKSLKDNYPKENSTVVKKLINEGALIIGSTNMSELAFSASNSYSSYGYVKNVFDVSYTPYGSSGGSAVAVKAAFAAASLGTDTNSSVRLPASGAGLVGIRPTLGLVSRNGVIPYDIERDTVGVLSRSVTDNALLLDIISGVDSKDKITEKSKKVDLSLDKASLEGVNIGVATQYVKGNANESGVTGLTDPAIYSMLEKSIRELEERGANIIYLDKFVRNSNLNIAYNTYAGGTMCDYFNDYIKGTTGTIRNFKELASSDGHVQRLSGYVEACGKSIKLKSKRDEKKKIYRDYVDEYFSEYDLDVILYPTLKNKVFKYTKTGNISPGSSLGSVIGYPSITVPMGFANDGFSYGIEFLGQAYGEDKLYNVALEYEKINGNVVDTSPITPNLYEIPREVLELKDLYEQLLNSDVSVGKVKEWISLVKTFFKNYNSYENLGEEALQLINKYHELSLANVLDEDFYDKSNFFKICVIVVIVIACLIIIKNFLRCF